MIILLKISFIAYMIYWLGDPEEFFAWHQKLIKDLPIWLYKPLGGCYRCFTGQICFWAYIVIYFKDYDLIDHGAFVAGGIFLSMIYNLLFAIICKLTDKFET
jgi:hypothetical protein